MPISSSSTITIRPSTTEDLNVITSIYAHHVLHGSATFETEPPDIEEMARRRATMLENGYPYLVALQNNEVLGYAYANTYRPRAAYCDTVENSIYLDPHAMGRGIGTQLLTALIEACEACGFRQMIAVVGDSANLPSIRVHERNGFCLIGTFKAVGYKHERWLDTVLLQRTLGAGATLPQQPRAK